MPRAMSPVPFLVAVTALTFSNVLWHEFVNFDDLINIYGNIHLKASPIKAIIYFWRHSYEGFFVPVTYSVWTVLAEVSRWLWPSVTDWEIRPYLFHGMNVLLHLGNGLLLYQLLQKMLPSTSSWIISIAVALFLVHPLQVETVAWASGMRDLLSVLFCLLAMNTYFAPFGRQEPVPRRTLPLSVFFFALALLSKPSAVILPLLLLALDTLWFRVPFPFSCFRLIPWFIMAAPIIVVTQALQAPHLGTISALSLETRGLTALDTLQFYITKLIVIHPLVIDYGREPLTSLGTANGLRIFLIFVAWFALHKVVVDKTRGLLLATLFLIVLLPVSGLIPFAHENISTVANRYVYFALIIPCVSVALLLGRFPFRMAMALGVMVVIAAATLSRWNVTQWKNSETLFSYTLRHNPKSYTAANNLGTFYEDNFLPEKALAHYRIAMTNRPEWMRARRNFVSLLTELGRIEEARPYMGSCEKKL